MCVCDVMSVYLQPWSVILFSLHQLLSTLPSCHSADVCWLCLMWERSRLSLHPLELTLKSFLHYYTQYRVCLCGLQHLLWMALFLSALLTVIYLQVFVKWAKPGSDKVAVISSSSHPAHNEGKRNEEICLWRRNVCMIVTCREQITFLYHCLTLHT